MQKECKYTKISNGRIYIEELEKIGLLVIGLQLLALCWVVNVSYFVLISGCNGVKGNVQGQM